MSDTYKDIERPFIKRVRELGNKDAIAEVIDSRIFDPILKTYKIDATTADLSKYLRFGLSYYLNDGPYGMHKTIKAETQQRRKQLQKISKMSEELKNEYDGEKETLWGWVQYAVLKRLNEELEGENINPEYLPLDNVDHSALILSQLLDILPKAIEHVIENKYQIQSGRPHERGLKRLIDYLARFWEKYKQSDFTVDHHAGASTSESLSFARDCILAIDDIPENAIISAARSVRDFWVTYKNTPEDEREFLTTDW